MEISHIHRLFLETSGPCTDTRNITNHSMFFALKGGNFNGNEFALKALENGSKYATGLPYQEYVRRNVLDPLRMSRTAFEFTDEIGCLAATAYQKRWSFMTPMLRLLLPRWVFGDAAGGFVALNRFHLDGAAYGGLIGTAEDAARFLRAHLNGGEADGARILSQQSAAQMQTVTAYGPRLSTGLGWMRPRNGSGYLEHLGGGGGYFSAMRIYLHERMGSVIMGNSTSYDHGAILDLVAGRWR